MKKVKKLCCIALVVANILSIALVPGQAASTSPEGVVAHYKFDTDFKDASGNGNDATKNGDVQIITDPNFGKVAEFSGGHLTVNNSASLKLGSNFSTTAWIKISPEANTLSAPLIDHLDDYSSFSIFYFGARNASSILEGYVTPQDAIGSENTQAGDLVLTEGWVLVALTYDGMDLKLFANGKVVASQAITNTLEKKELWDAQTRWIIGKDKESRTFKGRISDMRIYNKALSEDDVTAIYNEKNAGTKKITLWIGNPKMMVDDKQTDIDPGKTTSPVIVEGRTLVPIRSIVETMGGSVKWIGEDRRVEITLKDKTIKLWIDKTTASIGDKNLALDVPPQIMDGRTMLPLRFVSENLGAKLEWLGEKQQITILY